jgi:hypothetical protein
VRAPAQYGKGVLSRSVYLHLYQLLPINRTSETMRDLFGCALWLCHCSSDRDARGSLFFGQVGSYRVEDQSADSQSKCNTLS